NSHDSGGRPERPWTHRRLGSWTPMPSRAASYPTRDARSQTAEHRGKYREEIRSNQSNSAGAACPFGVQTSADGPRTLPAVIPTVQECPALGGGRLSAKG